MASILESTRALHEDLEKKQKTLIQQLEKQPRNHKEAVVLDHAISSLLQASAQDSSELAQLYEDKDGLRKAEVAFITTQTVFTNFYNRLRAIREYHAKFPDSIVTPDSDQPDADMYAPVPAPTVQFSGEENFGRQLDLHSLHERAVNLPQFAHRSRDYLSFLAAFAQFADVPRDKKAAPEYRKYITDLLDYLTSFHARIRPLYPIPTLLARISEDFAQCWAAGSLPGWGDSTDGAQSSADESNPLYCKPCAHLFPKDTVFASHLTGKKHKKNVEAMQSQATSSSLAGPAKMLTLWREIALIEHQIDLMAVLLRDFVANTQAFIEKKQTKTWEEIEAELLRAEREDIEGESEPEESDDESSSAGYNPLNIPLGWDGKPIPYWLYKLHGLNIEYNCEICGDFSYRGPRAYQRHFQEPRHSQGLRALGIPMHKAFNSIVKIADARALWEKIKDDASVVGAVSDGADIGAETEEVEDSMGNVFTRRAYEELRRQGIISS